MPWPKLDKVKCFDFPRHLLPAIKNAVDSNQVEWDLYPSIWADSCIGHFEWAGCQWEMIENQETVKIITLVRGTLNSEELTIAVLRC